MTYPLNLGRQVVPWDAPVRKTPVTCCGITCLQGVLAPWTCPGCQTVHDSHVPDAES